MPFRARLTHMGIRVTDMARMRRFYEEACGFLVSDAGVGPVSGLEYCFMTGSEKSHHQVVLADGRPKEATFTTVLQISFRLDSLDELRAARERGARAGAGDVRTMNHGNAWSVYMDDPEGNPLEFYVDTPWYVAQPFGDPLDLALNDAEIERITEERCRARPEFRPAAEWSEEMARRLSSAENTR